MKKLLTCLLALTLACTFIACNNNASGTSESWSVVTLAQKSSLVGTWKGNRIEENYSYICTVTIKNDFNINIEIILDYSSTPGIDVENTFGTGWTVNTLEKKATCNQSVTSNDFDDSINLGVIEINASTTKIRMPNLITQNAGKVVLTKQ